MGQASGYTLWEAVGGCRREGNKLAATGISQRPVSPDRPGDRELTPREVVIIPRQDRQTSLLSGFCLLPPPAPLPLSRGLRTGCGVGRELLV